MSTTSACECTLWRSMDGLEEATDELIERGFATTDERDDLLGALVGIAVRWGFQPPYQVARAIGVSAICKQERKRIVDAYAKFSATAANDNKRGAKLRSMGVSKYQISRWANEIYPGKLRHLNVPRHTVILEILSKRPWATMAEIIGEAGICRETVISALQRLYNRGVLTRRKGGRGVYEYDLCRKDIQRTKATAAVANKKAAGARTVDGRRRAA